MRIHWASGHHPFDPPWINVDFFAYDGVGLIADLLREIPAEIQNIEISYVGHFLEHLTPEEGVDFLRRVRARTQPDGQLVIVGPDVGKSQNLYDQGLLPLELLESTKLVSLHKI